MAGAFGKPALQGAGQLQLVEIEHRQGEQHEHQGKAAQHPGILQGAGKQGAGQAGQDADGGVGERHAEHVDQGQGGGAAARRRAVRVVALAGDDARKNGQHGEHAGRAGQPESGEEEKGEVAPETGLGESPGDLAAAVARAGRCRGFGKVRHAGAGGRQGDGKLPHLRRITDAGFGAALQGELEVEGRRVRRAGAEGQDEGWRAAVDGDLAEIFVLLFFGGRQLRRTQGGVFARKAQFVAIDVVTRRDLELQAEAIGRFGLCLDLESLGRIEEWLGGERSCAQEGNNQDEAGEKGGGVRAVQQTAHAPSVARRTQSR
jgi:hypothetical protein